MAADTSIDLSGICISPSPLLCSQHHHLLSGIHVALYMNPFISPLALQHCILLFAFKLAVHQQRTL
jgi:hypothetical protein